MEINPGRKPGVEPRNRLADNFQASNIKLYILLDPVGIGRVVYTIAYVCAMKRTFQTNHQKTEF